MSAIGTAVREYLELRRALGFKLHLEGRWLEQFALFLGKRRRGHVTAKLALEWATQAKRAHLSHLARRLGVVRAFASFYATRDHRTEVPALGLIPAHYHRKPPHIYTDDEIAHLLRGTLQLPSKKGLRGQTYATLISLLVVTGMRIGEAVNLDREDIDLSTRLITVRRTKFGKSRFVPLSASSCRALERYAIRRDQTVPRQLTPSFLVGERGERLTVNVAEKTFVKLSRKVGLRSLTDRTGPRLHDLRHRFAVHTLLRWYRTGVDVERQLPKLSTYLGHAHPTDTYWYLSAAPELMHLVVARLERSEGRSA